MPKLENIMSTVMSKVSAWIKGIDKRKVIAIGIILLIAAVGLLVNLANAVLNAFR